MRRCLGNSCKAFDFSRGLFTWTGDTTFDGHKIKGGRQMFGIATSYHNVPENITAELTTDYDEATGTFTFYGTTAKDSGKILRASKSGTGVSVSWVKQLRENEQADWGWNYYDSYGISFDADVDVIRGADLNTGCLLYTSDAADD